MLKRGNQSPLNHVHIAKRVRVDGAKGKRPVSMPCSFCRIAQKVAVERGVLPRERPVRRLKCPFDKLMDQLSFCLFFWVFNLLKGKAVYLERLVHHMCAVPNMALCVQLAVRFVKINRSNAYY